MSFYDITKNAPGALLTRLSIDTMQLNNLVYSILGSTVQCGATFVLGMILGCIYEYRLTLIMFCFVPFIALAIIIRRGLNRGSGKMELKLMLKQEEFYLNVLLILKLFILLISKMKL